MAKSSPFEGVHQQMGAQFAEYDGWRLPKDYGNPAAESGALSQSSAAFDLCSFGRFSVPAAGATALAGLLAEGTLPDDGAWIRTSMNGTGPIRAARIRNQFLVLTMPSSRQAVSERMQKAGIAAVDVTDKTGMLGVYGPDAFRAVSKIIPLDLSELEPGAVVSHSFFMITVTALRGGWLNTDGLELICPASAAGLAAGAIAKYHKQQNIVPAGMDCLIHALGNG